ncbi:MAG: hypothetical protein JWM31_2836 [Solirubrobacterales bacterium]|nr:hypothetical protein [Solirubrobacterales bacterium]
MATAAYPTKKLKTCADAVAQLATENDAGSRKLLRDARLNKVDVVGTKATITSTASGPLKLTRLGGRWVITKGLY